MNLKISPLRWTVFLFLLGLSLIWNGSHLLFLPIYTHPISSSLLTILYLTGSIAVAPAVAGPSKIDVTSSTLQIAVHEGSCSFPFVGLRAGILYGMLSLTTSLCPFRVFAGRCCFHWLERSGYRYVGLFFYIFFLPFRPSLLFLSSRSRSVSGFFLNYGVRRGYPYAMLALYDATSASGQPIRHVGGLFFFLDIVCGMDSVALIVTESSLFAFSRWVLSCATIPGHPCSVLLLSPRQRRI
jgi:hypothetical protein